MKYVGKPHPPLFFHPPPRKMKTNRLLLWMFY